jgi:hypothetical protein
VGKEREKKVIGKRKARNHPLNLRERKRNTHQYRPLPSPLSKTISGSLFDQTKLALGPPTLLLRFNA